MSCRPLTDLEYTKVKNALNNPRDYLLFVLGYRTGFRISEILSLEVADVLHSKIKVQRKNMKGKTQSREVAIHPELASAIASYLSIRMVENDNTALFPSRQGGSIGRHMAHQILKKAYAASGLSGSGYATHCMRKSFSKNIYKKSGNDLVLTQKALGHKDIVTTVKYLNVFQDDIDSLILE